MRLKVSSNVFSSDSFILFYSMVDVISPGVLKNWYLPKSIYSLMYHVQRIAFKFVDFLWFVCNFLLVMASRDSPEHVLKIEYLPNIINFLIHLSFIFSYIMLSLDYILKINIEIVLVDPLNKNPE